MKIALIKKSVTLYCIYPHCSADHWFPMYLQKCSLLRMTEARCLEINFLLLFHLWFSSVQSHYHKDPGACSKDRSLLPNTLALLQCCLFSYLQLFFICYNQPSLTGHSPHNTYQPIISSVNCLFPGF